MPARVTVLREALRTGAPDEADNLRQVEEVSGALQRLGYDVRRLSVGPDLAALANEDAASLGVAFNLVEGLGAAHFLPSAVAHYLCWRGVMVTGADGEHLTTLCNKLLLRKMIAGAGVATPALFGDAPEVPLYIVKSVREHASLGIHGDSIVPGAGVSRLVAARQRTHGGDWFAEEFIAGREFCVAGIAEGDGVFLLPATEIMFINWPASAPRIVDYAAKWHEGSPQEVGTPRRFLKSAQEGDLVEKLIGATRALWHHLRLLGYARFDYRLGADGTLYLIDLNPNPGLATDAGFAAMGVQAGLAYHELIGRILRGVDGS